MALLNDDRPVMYLLTAKEAWILEENWPSFYSSLLTTYTQVLKNESIKIETASNDDDSSSLAHGNGKAGSIFGILKEKEGRITYECEYCHHCFIDRSSIVQHRRLHTGEKPFKCGICRKSFAVKSSLTEHVRRHRGEKRFKCDACHKSFVSKRELNSHSRFHTGEKPFQCHICDKSFSRNVSLTEHIRRHRGERPFKCEICDKSFVSRRKLKSHSRRCCTPSMPSNDSKYDDTKAEEGRNDVVSSRTSENDKAVDASTECSRIVDIDTVKHSEPCRKEKTSYSCDKCDKVFDGIFKLYKHKRWQCYYTALEALKQQKLERGLSPIP